MVLAEIAKLKQRLVDADDCADIITDFLIHVSNHDELVEMGDFVENSFLVDLIRKVGLDMFGEDGVLQHPMLIRVPEARLLHGAFSLGGRVSNVIYFEDVGLGAMGIANKDGHRPRTDFVRFAACATVEVGNRMNPSRN